MTLIKNLFNNKNSKETTVTSTDHLLTNPINPAKETIMTEKNPIIKIEFNDDVKDAFSSCKDKVSSIKLPNVNIPKVNLPEVDVAKGAGVVVGTIIDLSKTISEKTTEKTGSIWDSIAKSYKEGVEFATTKETIEVDLEKDAIVLTKVEIIEGADINS